MPSQEFIKGPSLSSSAAGNRPLRTKSVLRKTKSCAASLDLKKVWFNTVEIKYHKIILGDNPAVSEGAPITIHWKAYDQEIIDVDDFEIRQKLIAKERNDKKNARKASKSSSSTLLASTSSTSSSAVTGKSSSSSSLSLDTNALWSLIDKERDCHSLKMDVHERAKILLRSGYSIRDIAKRTHEVQEIQRERIKSATSTKWDGINFALESSGRAFRRLTRLELGGGGGGGSGGSGSGNNITPRNGRIQNPAA